LGLPNGLLPSGSPPPHTLYPPLLPSLKPHATPIWLLIIRMTYGDSTGHCRFQWPRSLRRGSAAACLLESRFGIPSRARVFPFWECWVLSGSECLCNELITRPEECFLVWCVWVWSRNLVKEDV
jgi:hypothetical protein